MNSLKSKQWLGSSCAMCCMLCNFFRRYDCSVTNLLQPFDAKFLWGAWNHLFFIIGYLSP